MLELDLWFFLIAGPATIFAGISKGGFGSGAAFAASSILALALDPGLALGVMLPLLMLINVAALPFYWGKWDFRAAGLLIVGSLLGVAIGAWLYSVSEPDVFRILIGLISILFVIWQFAGARGWVRPGTRVLPTGSEVLRV